VFLRDKDWFIAVEEVREKIIKKLIENDYEEKQRQEDARQKEIDELTKLVTGLSQKVEQVDTKVEQVDEKASEAKKEVKEAKNEATEAKEKATEAKKKVDGVIAEPRRYGDGPNACFPEAVEYIHGKETADFIRKARADIGQSGGVFNVYTAIGKLNEVIEDSYKVFQVSLKDIVEHFGKGGKPIIAFEYSKQEGRSHAFIVTGIGKDEEGRESLLTQEVMADGSKKHRRVEAGRDGRLILVGAPKGTFSKEKELSEEEARANPEWKKLAIDNPVDITGAVDGGSGGDFGDGNGGDSGDGNGGNGSKGGNGSNGGKGGWGGFGSGGAGFGGFGG